MQVVNHYSLIIVLSNQFYEYNRGFKIKLKDILQKKKI